MMAMNQHLLVENQRMLAEGLQGIHRLESQVQKLSQIVMEQHDPTNPVPKSWAAQGKTDFRDMQRQRYYKMPGNETRPRHAMERAVNKSQNKYKKSRKPKDV